jgi:hypothetical protein
MSGGSVAANSIQWPFLDAWKAGKDLIASFICGEVREESWGDTETSRLLNLMKKPHSLERGFFNC